MLTFRPGGGPFPVPRNVLAVRSKMWGRTHEPCSAGWHGCPAGVCLPKPLLLYVSEKQPFQTPELDLLDLFLPFQSHTVILRKVLPVLTACNSLAELKPSPFALLSPHCTSRRRRKLCFGTCAQHLGHDIAFHKL